MSRRPRKMEGELPLFESASPAAQAPRAQAQTARRGARKPADAAEQTIFTVAELTRKIKQCLEREIGSVWLVGEISNLRTPSSGHVYMTLKDDQSQISAVAFRRVAQYLKFRLVDGLEVVVFGRVSVYEPRGDYQIIVEKIEPKGQGALDLAFRQLKEKLEKEGLFDPARKKPLPAFPQRIGIVTSPTGAAIRDMLDVIFRRFPGMQVYLRPVRVQGEGAAEEIAAAVADFNAWGRVDVLIVGRGGGSLEDLWAFNEEVVARAIAASEIPVISAVGHEIDVTISDLVADYRALTPTAAGEVVAPDRGALLDALDGLKRRLAQALLRRLALARQQLEALRRSYGLSRPLEPIRQRQQRADDAVQRLQTAARSRLELARRRLASAGARLEGVSPLAVLARGYSVTMKADGSVLRDAADARVDDRLVTVLSRGRVESVVTRRLDEAAPADASSARDEGNGEPTQ